MTNTRNSLDQVLMLITKDVLGLDRPMPLAPIDHCRVITNLFTKQVCRKLFCIELRVLSVPYRNFLQLLSLVVHAGRMKQIMCAYQTTCT